jgi:glutamyl-tRNA synthetase
VAAAGDRLKVAADIVNYLEFFADDTTFPYDPKAFSKRLRSEGSAERLLAFRHALESLAHFDAETIEAEMHDFVATNDIKVSAIIHAVRIAVTGKAVGFGLFEGMAILGRNACLVRIDRALALVTNKDTP